jgi:hypothetical protein
MRHSNADVYILYMLLSSSMSSSVGPKVQAWARGAVWARLACFHPRSVPALPTPSRPHCVLLMTDRYPSRWRSPSEEPPEHYHAYGP